MERFADRIKGDHRIICSPNILPKFLFTLPIVESLAVRTASDPLQRVSPLSFSFVRVH